VNDVTAQLKQLLVERILVLDGSWGVLARGGTHGSPTSPLLLGSAENDPAPGLPPGKARLGPARRGSWENA
jgi:hypothetical protein